MHCGVSNDGARRSPPRNRPSNPSARPRAQSQPHEPTNQNNASPRRDLGGCRYPTVLLACSVVPVAIDRATCPAPTRAPSRSVAALRRRVALRWRRRRRRSLRPIRVRRVRVGIPRHRHDGRDSPLDTRRRVVVTSADRIINSPRTRDSRRPHHRKGGHIMVAKIERRIIIVLPVCVLLIGGLPLACVA